MPNSAFVERHLGAPIAMIGLTVSGRTQRAGLSAGAWRNSQASFLTC